MLLMDLSISSKRNVSAFQATFFEMLSAWSASFLAGMTRISREMNHRACKERRRSLLPMRAAVVAESRFSSFEVPRQPHHFSIADNPNVSSTVYSLVGILVRSRLDRKLRRFLWRQWKWYCGQG